MATVIGYVEDEDLIRQNYTELLTQEGFVVDAFSNRHDAITHFIRSTPDLALLDISLGDERDGGFQLLQEMRRELPGSLPIVFFTSHDSEIDEIIGLRVGADEYIDKNTSFPLLLARLERLFRRVAELDAVVDVGVDQYERDALTVNMTMLTVQWRGELVKLPLTQFWIVDCLAKRPGQPKSYDALMEAAQLSVTRNAISVHIKNIRQRFQDVDPDFNCLKTERGLGYRWVP